MCGDREGEAGDPGGDQHQIGHRARCDDSQHVFAADALAQHERVLRAPIAAMSANVVAKPEK